ncbi:hypothetical protein KI387_035876 [Taxus chinensis]|uniref:S-adenosylmethionine synthetase N-terminal domain-containing protein n=1 Tax=Taxus chinensis TaxID=29808 RepID=A0AA38FPT9_TAXCH|nr:hypothetical protein KI387_035876 [Taxus chinensis]
MLVEKKISIMKKTIVLRLRILHLGVGYILIEEDDTFDEEEVEDLWMDTFFFTSESINEGHPDKPCDQISDTMLDACLEQDPNIKVACETCTNTNMVIVFGEITTKADVDYKKFFRKTCREIDFISDDVGLDAENCIVFVNIEQQSLDISQ